MPLFGGSVATRLIKEAKRGERGRVDELLADLRAQNGHPNAADANGWTALHWATWKGHLEVVQSLVHAPRIDLELRTVDKSRTALYLAAYGGLDRIFSLLLTAGARMDTTDYGGYTVLHAAAEAGHGTVVRLLLEHLDRTSHADIIPLLERVDRECGWTALHWAAYQGHTAVVRRLIEYGADVNTPDPRGRTAADIACTGERADVHNKHLVVEELRTPFNERGSQASFGQRLTAQPSLGSSFAAGGPTLHPDTATHHLRQSNPPSDSTSDRQSNGYIGLDHPTASLHALQIAGANADPALMSNSFAGAQHPPPHLPPNQSLPPQNTLSSISLRNGISSGNSIPQPSPGRSGGSGDPRLRIHNPATSSGPSYTNARYHSNSVSTSSVSGGSQRTPRRATGATGPRLSDTRQLGDQFSMHSSQSPGNSQEGLIAAHVEQALPDRAAELRAVGGMMGVGMGAAGAGAVLAGGVMSAIGAVATCNPGTVIMGIFATAAQLAALCEDAVYCRYKARRLRARTQTLQHCLKALPEQLPQHAVPLQVAYEQTLVCLDQVLRNIFNLVQRFSSRTDNLLGKTMEFLRSMGFREEFEVLDSELHSCTSQLMLVMQILSLAPQEEAVNGLREVPQWLKQNQEDRARDMQELEQQILGALCGLGQQGMRIEDAVRELEKMLQEHNQDLGQVVSLLQRMDAGHVSLSGHLRRVADRVDEVAVMTGRILAYLQQSQRARGRDVPLPPFLIPSSTIRIDETPEQDQWGGCGWVVKAYRDRFGVVAIKMYNTNQVGEMDMEAAVREAVKLCRVNHHNVVRCYGILTDEMNAMGRHSVSGSLVMEWVEGGDMYRWLQHRNALVAVDVGTRIQVMLQVAAGMKHLHQQNLVHGDVKHQNILLEFPERPAMEEGALDAVVNPVPTVKICDFGLAKYNATTTTASTVSNRTTAKYSLRYTSPERLKTMRRSFEDDVFAFGMLMYFAVTSEDPFSFASDEDCVSGVQRGSRPDIDDWVAHQRGGAWETLAMQYAELAKQCWDHDPKQRPNFQEVYVRLEDMVWPSADPRVL